MKGSRHVARPLRDRAVGLERDVSLHRRGVDRLMHGGGGLEALGDIAGDGTVAVRIYHKPLVLLIWFGPVLMAFGGMLSLSDRRLRVGAPKPAKSLRGLQAAE